MTQRDSDKPIAVEYVPLRSASDAETEAALLRRIEESHARGDATAIEQSVLDFAVSCSRTGQQRRAVPELERLAAPGGDPERVARALLSLGQLLEQTKDYEAARAHYARGVQIDTQERTVRYFLHNNLAFCLLRLGRPAEVEPFCRAAIGIDPRRHNARKNLGLALAAQGRLAEAAAAYLDAVELAPRDTRSLMHLQGLLRENPRLIDADPELGERLDRALAASQQAAKKLQ